MTTDTFTYVAGLVSLTRIGVVESDVFVFMGTDYYGKSGMTDHFVDLCLASTICNQQTMNTYADHSVITKTLSHQLSYHKTYW